MIDSYRTEMWDVRRPNLHVDVIQKVLDQIGNLHLVIVLLEGLSQSKKHIPSHFSSKYQHVIL